MRKALISILLIVSYTEATGLDWDYYLQQASKYESEYNNLANLYKKSFALNEYLECLIHKKKFCETILNEDCYKESPDDLTNKKRSEVCETFKYGCILDNNQWCFSPYKDEAYV